MITATKTTGTYMGLNYEIGSTGTSYYYSVWDMGRVTNKRIELACASSCRNEFTVEYVENVIKETLEVM